MMQTQASRYFCAAIVAAAAQATLAQTFEAVQRDDVVYGLNRGPAADTTQLIRGYPTGSKLTNEWAATFVQSVQLDNTDGFRHSTAPGNLLGVNFGPNATVGGSIYNMQTVAGTNPGASTIIFDFATYNAANPASPLAVSRLNGIAPSPDNTKVALHGTDGGNLYVFDYQPDVGAGGAATLSNGRQFSGVVTAGSSAGAAWLDNDNVLITDNGGALKKVQVSTGSVSTVANFTQAATASFFSSITYEPTISPYAYVLASGLASGVTVNKLHVIDLSTGSIVVTRDYSTSMNTGRETAFNSVGDLIASEFGNSLSVPVGGSMELIPDAWNSGSLADNVSSKYYIQVAGLSAQFSGMDVASNMLDYVTPGVTVNMRKRDHTQAYFEEGAPFAQLRQKLQIGYAGGAWNGAGGILSTDAAASAIQDGIGYDQVPAPSLGGQGEFRIRYTLLGDATLDGTVNIGDFSLLGANFNQAGFWPDGDFNYDGSVNIGDFSLLAANFNQSVPPGDLPRGAVPEPISGAIVAIGALVVRRR